MCIYTNAYTRLYMYTRKIVYVNVGYLYIYTYIMYTHEIVYVNIYTLYVFM